MPLAMLRDQYHFVSLSLEGNNLPGGNSDGDADRQVHFFLADLPGIAILAFYPLVEQLAEALAVLALLFGLRVHSWAHLHQLDDASLALADRALFYVLASLSLAALAESCPLVVQLDDSARKNLFKRNFEDSFCRLHFRLLVVLLPCLLRITEHHVEHAAMSS